MKTPIDHRHHWVPVLLAAWLLGIFGTSSTVVRPNEFFSLIQNTLQLDDRTLGYFQIFWGSAWLLIVKGWHFTEFAVLMLLCMAAIRWFTGSLSTGKILSAAIFCIGFAASDEWHQSFIPDRLGTLWDVGVDTLGVAITTLWALRRLPQQSSNSSQELENI